MKNTIAVVLAAGEGTRFKSNLPKVLHTILGKTLIKRVVEKLKYFRKTVIIIGHKGDIVKNAVKNGSVGKQKIIFAVQERQLGSGDALKKARNAISGFSGNILVLCGDTPLIKTETLKELIAFHNSEKADCTVLTFETNNPRGYGRIVKNGNCVEQIVEEKDASSEIKKIKEVNSGIYVFSAPLLFPALEKISPDNAKKEYYLTDAVSVLNANGKKVAGFKIENGDEVMGINNRVELATAEKIIREEVLNKLMLSGVTITDPQTTCIDETVKISNDTTIMPSTIIKNNTVIKSGCLIGPFTYIKDSRIGNNVEIRASFIYGASIADGVKIGPFSHIRAGTKLRRNSRIGNFSEIKKSVICEDTKVSHLSYIGDSYLGKDVNIGAGTITCNYDGKIKHKTRIGNNVFVGSNTNFVAPVKIGSGALIAAGSTITEDVPKNALSIARARQLNKNWKKKKAAGR